VPEEELQQTALSVAERLASGSPSAIRFTKLALNGWLRAAGPAFDASLALEFLGMSGPDVHEGIASVRERRPPAVGGQAEPRRPRGQPLPRKALGTLGPGAPNTTDAGDARVTAPAGPDYRQTGRVAS